MVLSVPSAQEGRCPADTCRPIGICAGLTGSLWPALPNQCQLRSLLPGLFAPMSAHPALEGGGGLQQPVGTDSSQASLGAELSRVGVG